LRDDFLPLDDPVQDSIPILRAPTLQGREIVAGFSTRRGGVSAPPFDELNLSARDDDPGSVAENLLRFCRASGLTRCPPAVQRQVHGCSVTWVGGRDGPDPVGARSVEGDALVTRTRGMPIAVQVADCVPLLLWDPVNGVVAAAHAGWRGTACKVVEATIEQMRQRAGSDAADIRAAIGPTIGGCCYEVGPEVVEALAGAFEEDAFLADDRGGRPRVDLGNANHAALLRAGVPQESISRVGGCTACSTEYFSYRRDGPRTGRMMGVIQLL